jgi:hypothetical protein
MLIKAIRSFMFHKSDHPSRRSEQEFSHLQKIGTIMLYFKVSNPLLLSVDKIQHFIRPF